MWRAVAKYNEAQSIMRNNDKEKELDERDIKRKKEENIEKIKIIKRKLMQNKIQEDLLNLMKNDYLTRINYNDYMNSPIEIKELYEEIYIKIFDLQKEQKEIKKEYEDLLYLI
jgi:hypothetical protein